MNNDKQPGLGPYYGMLALFVVVALVGVRQSQTPAETIQNLHEYATTNAEDEAQDVEVEAPFAFVNNETGETFTRTPDEMVAEARMWAAEYTAAEDIRRMERVRYGEPKLIYLPSTTPAHERLLQQEWEIGQARIAANRRWELEDRMLQREEQEFIVQTRVEEQRLADQRAHERELAILSAPVVNVEQPQPRGVACGPYGTDNCEIDVRIIH